MKTIKKLYKYFFGLAILVSLVSFSASTNYNSLQINNTEWVVSENIPSSNTASFSINIKDIRKSLIKINHSFNFDCFLNVQQSAYNLNFKTMSQLRLQIKYLNPFFELEYTNSFFNRDNFYSDFLV